MENLRRLSLHRRCCEIQLFTQKLAADKSINSEPFNFSLENDLEIIELVEKIKEIMNSSLEIQVDSNKAEIKFMQVSSKKAKNFELGSHI